MTLKPLVLLVALAAALSPSLAAAYQPRTASFRLAQASTSPSSETEAVTIRTKDGRLHVGKVIRKLSNGVLFRTQTGETYLIEASNIDQGEGEGEQQPETAPQSTEAETREDRAPATTERSDDEKPLPPPSAGTPEARIEQLETELAKLRKEREQATFLIPMIGLVGGAAGLGAYYFMGAPENLRLVFYVSIGSVVLGAAHLVYTIVRRSSLDRDIRERQDQLTAARKELTLSELFLPSPACDDSGCTVAWRF